MTIHFICMGNMYRSRLAEAYIKSLHIKGTVVMSSGLMADNVGVRQGPISPYAKTVLKHYGLTTYAKASHDQLTQERLESSDVVVCVNRAVYDRANKHYKLPMRTLIWDIADVNEVYRHHPSYLLDHHRVGELAERTFVQIQRRVDELVLLIKRTSRKKAPIDVLHPDGRPAGYTASLTEANSKGLWHAGVHAALFTVDGQVLVEQRSETIITNPGLWEMTLGGAVDAGETPDETVVREIHEELGLSVKMAGLTKVGLLRENHYMPTYGFHDRVMLHLYIGKLPKSMHVRLQASEVQDWQLVPIETLRQQIEGRDKSIALIHYPALHKKLLDAIESQLPLRA